MKRIFLGLMLALLLTVGSVFAACGNDTKSLDVPGGLKFEGSTLSWEPVSGAINYNIEIGTSSQKTRETSLKLNSLHCNFDYKARVQALGDGRSVKDSDFSGYLEFTTESEGFSHSMGAWSVFTPPTCTEVGEERKTCVRCDHFESREIEALGHDYAWEVTIPATETTDGLETRYCDRCDFSDGETRVSYATGTEGLLFIENDAGTGYKVFGASGAMTDKEIIYVPEFHNRLPVTEIPPASFSNLVNLKKIIMGKNVEIIGTNSFAGCTSLQEMHLPFIGESRFAGGAQAVLGHLFAEPSSATATSTQQYYAAGTYKHYEIPASLQKIVVTDAIRIDYGAFSNCKMLKYVDITAELSIEEIAFQNATELQNVKISGTLVSIKANAFDKCSKLTTVELSDSINTIAKQAFRDCIALVQIKLPQSLKLLGNQSFMNCSALTSISLPQGLTDIGENSNITTGGSSTDGRVFLGCASLSSIALPSSLKYVGTYTFQSTANITVYMPSVPYGWHASWTTSDYQTSGVGAIIYNSSLATDEDGTYVQNIAKSGNLVTNTAANHPTAYDPLRVGYTFLGWSTTPNGTVSYNSSQALKNAANATYYSIWQKQS